MCVDFEYAYQISLLIILYSNSLTRLQVTGFKPYLQFYHIRSLITVLFIAAAPEIRRLLDVCNTHSPIQRHLIVIPKVVWKFHTPFLEWYAESQISPVTDHFLTEIISMRCPDSSRVCRLYSIHHDSWARHHHSYKPNFHQLGLENRFMKWWVTNHPQITHYISLRWTIRTTQINSDLQVCVVLFQNPKTLNPWTVICWLIASRYWELEVCEYFEETLVNVIPNYQPGWMGVGKDQNQLMSREDQRPKFDHDRYINIVCQSIQLCRSWN